LEHVDYSKLEKTHHLSWYAVVIPVRQGTQNIRMPFAPWSASKPLDRYRAYNDAKHDRHAQFPRSQFSKLTRRSLRSGLAVVAISRLEFPSPRCNPHIVRFGRAAGRMRSCNRRLFSRKVSQQLHSKQYDFDWQKVATTPSPVDTIPNF
jgi:hypothetical protein